MKPEDIKKIVDDLISSKTKYLWVYILLSFILGMVATFISSYVITKSQGLATKSDITDLTKKVEEVKSEYLKQLEVFKGNLLIKNPQKKDLYDKVIALRIFIIKAINDKQFNDFNWWEKLSSQMKDIIISLNTNAIFNYLSSERDILEKEHNNIVTQIMSKINGKKGIVHITIPNISFEQTVKTLETIQIKLLE